MTRGVRRQIRILQIYSVISFLALTVVGTAAMTQARNVQRIDELTVQRLNVVDANGTLRLVLSNKDRMHPGVMDGKTINRPRPVAGLIFFNDVGDEVGGLVFSGHEVNGQGQADASLTLDQWKQDQTIGISYGENRGQRQVALRVWDRPETQRLSELIGAMNAAAAIQDPVARDAATKAALAKAQPSHERVFVGKDFSRASVITLSDAEGKPRLRLKVQADGGASLEFLDANGNVTNRLPQ
jgi:hypothetical protein